MSILRPTTTLQNRISTLCIAAISGIAASQSAQAAFVMTLEETLSGDSAVIYDSTAIGSTASDLNGAIGAITYSGVLGNFTINVTTGVSKPAVGPGIVDLNSINVTSSAGGGTLVIRITDTDFSGGYNNYRAAYGGTTDGAVEFSFLYGATNTEFGGTPYVTGDFTASAGDQGFAADLLGVVTPATPYSLSIIATINHATGGMSTSFNAVASPKDDEVPLPAATYLFGSALIGLSLIRNKR